MLTSLPCEFYRPEDTTFIADSYYVYLLKTPRSVYVKLSSLISLHRRQKRLVISFLGEECEAQIDWGHLLRSHSKWLQHLVFMLPVGQLGTRCCWLEHATGVLEGQDS